jgi:hypothetical protein
MQQIPFLSLPFFFGGQMGVPGSEAAEGLRLHPDAVVIYVDSGHADADDNHDGTNPIHPKATVQAAVNSSLLTNHSIIMVSGTVSEDVVTPDYATGPNYVSIIGNGPSRYSVLWEGDDADTPSLDLRAVGWRVEGFRFYGKTGASCVVLRHTDTGDNDIAIRTVIANCYFDGTTGLRGIESHGCYDVWIIGCTFALWHNGANTAIGMEVTTTPLAIPYRNYVLGNFFHDSDNGMQWESNGSFFGYNVVQPTGYAYSMAAVFQTSVAANPGDDNVVWMNTFPGDYSVVGGYRAGANDAWLGNMADDIAEAEVADNGWTILPPT